MQLRFRAHSLLVYLIDLLTGINWVNKRGFDAENYVDCLRFMLLKGSLTLGLTCRADKNCQSYPDPSLAENITPERNAQNSND